MERGPRRTVCRKDESAGHNVRSWFTPHARCSVARVPSLLPAAGHRIALFKTLMLPRRIR